MKIKFKNRLRAIDWIANFVRSEEQFEDLREQLNFNQIYTGNLYIEVEKDDSEEEEDLNKVLEKI